MAESAARLDLLLPSAAEIEETAAQALAAAGVQDAVLRLFATPGREGDARGHLFALVSSLPTHFDALRERGLKVVSLILGPEAAVRISAPWLLGGVKSTSYAVNVSAEKEAKSRGADDAVFTTLENRMKCGLGKCGRCNIGPVYVCKDGPVFTAAQMKQLPPEF